MGGKFDCKGRGGRGSRAPSLHCNCKDREFTGVLMSFLSGVAMWIDNYIAISIWNDNSPKMAFSAWPATDYFWLRYSLKREKDQILGSGLRGSHYKQPNREIISCRKSLSGYKIHKLHPKNIHLKFYRKSKMGLKQKERLPVISMCTYFLYFLFSGSLFCNPPTHLYLLFMLLNKKTVQSNGRPLKLKWAIQPVSSRISWDRMSHLVHCICQGLHEQGCHEIPSTKSKDSSRILVFQGSFRNFQGWSNW